MADDELDVDAMLERFRDRAAAVRERPMPPVAGPQREKKLEAVRKQINKIQSELVALTDPASFGPVAMGARDAKTVGDTEIRIRGEAEKIGPTVPRGFLSAFDVFGAPKINSRQSGRALPMPVIDEGQQISLE